MGRPKKTAEDWAVEYTDLEVRKKARFDTPGEASTSATVSTLVCKYCRIEISPDPAKKPYDRIREHISSARHARMKAQDEIAKTEKEKQPTIFDITVRQRDKEKKAQYKTL